MSEMPTDSILRRIAGFVHAVYRRPLTDSQSQALTIRLIDAMACGILARGDAESAGLVAALGSEAGQAGIIGGGRANTDNAAFLNCYLIRKLDWNDTYIGKNGGHPSDIIGGVLAAGEAAGASGEAILRAISAGTHLMLDLCDAASALSRGWDPSTYIGIAAAGAISCVAGLDEKQTAQAIAMTVVSRNMLLARTGRVSSWKTLASATAVRDCLFHVTLARLGQHGPDPAFEGKYGFETMVSGKLELELDSNRDRTAGSQLKFYPAIYHAQGPIESCLALHREVEGEIEDVLISIYDFAIRYSADSPAKWSPANIETADHSLPFIAAHALALGEFGPGSLRDSLLREKVKDLAARVRIEPEPAFSARWPLATPSRVTVRAGGKIYEKSVEYIIGHPARPLGLGEVRTKFLGAATPFLGQTNAANWLSRLETSSIINRASRLLELS